MKCLMTQIPLIKHFLTGVTGLQLTEQMRFCENVCLPFIATAGNRQTDQHRFHIGAGVENIEQLLL